MVKDFPAKTGKVELYGGPLNGMRLELKTHITEFQKACGTTTYYRYVITDRRTEDDHVIFEYAGIGGGRGS